MRDPSRIDTILQGVKDVWSTVPDLRLGQLLLNALPDPALYYLEDEELIKYLNKYYTGDNE